MKLVACITLLICAALPAEEPLSKRFVSLQQILDLPPSSLDFGSKRKPNPGAIAAANTVLAREAVGQRAAITLTIDRFEKVNGQLRGRTPYRHTVRVGNNALQLSAFVYVNEGSLPEVAAHASAAAKSWPVYGQISRAEIVNGGRELILDIASASLHLGATTMSEVVPTKAETPPSPLAGQTWQWRTGMITFGADGKISTANGGWESMGLTTRWRHQGKGRVMLYITAGRKDKLTCYLHFSEDWQSYTGNDFDGVAFAEPQKRVK